VGKARVIEQALKRSQVPPAEFLESMSFCERLLHMLVKIIGLSLLITGVVEFNLRQSWLDAAELNDIWGGSVGVNCVNVGPGGEACTQCEPNGNGGSIQCTESHENQTLTQYMNAAQHYSANVVENDPASCGGESRNYPFSTSCYGGPGSLYEVGVCRRKYTTYSVQGYTVMSCPPDSL
jgi:hypothetical protein